MQAVLTRQKSDSKQTLGKLELYDATGKMVYECKTLELADRNNEKQKSCIPKGRYNVTIRHSLKYGRHFWVNNVPNRNLILIHYGNYNSDILGCILVGATYADINKDGFPDVTSSKATLAKLLQSAPEGFTLTIQ